jgi:phenylacetate-coenzyme A ligase PaaK-like adenylate-forming protein
VIHTFEDKIFRAHSNDEFEKIALSLFDLHYHNNEIYRKYCDLINVNPKKITSLKDIPFLPIQFFKSHPIVLQNQIPQITFTSSGTSGPNTSHHLVPFVSIYEKSFTQSFNHFFPNHNQQVIIGLLPSYMEREGSSLIYMVEKLIAQNNTDKCIMEINLSPNTLQILQNPAIPKILIGVTFALLNLAEKGLKLSNTQVIETGGMKGMRKEIVREELHEILQEGLGIKKVYSEYGMTELLSQAYLLNHEYFESLSWLRFRVRNINDPLSHFDKGKGALNIIDLANLYSCPFIATDDLAEVLSPNKVQILGRMDHSQTRGCNLLLA